MRCSNPAALRLMGCGIAASEVVELVLGHGDLLLHLEEMALVFEHLGLETLHRELGDLRGIFLQFHGIERALLHLDHRLQDGHLAVEREQLEVGLRDLGDEIRHHEVPALPAWSR
jgi:hypothetical protein